MTWLRNSICIQQWNEIIYPWPNFKKDLVKLLLAHMLFFIQALNSFNLCYYVY